MELKLRNLSINYEVRGQGKPIIMLHGYSPDHRLMSGSMEPIFTDRSGYKRIYFDLPGMGKTKSANWITNSDIMLDIVIEFIESVIPNENFLLAGESYGGYLSRGIIQKMPHRVDGLFLLCPCIVAERIKRITPPHVVLKRDSDILLQLDPLDAEKFDSIAVVQTNKTWERFRDEVLTGLKIADVPFLTHFQNTGFEFSFAVDNLEEAYTKPVLILAGRQDSCVGYTDSWNILDNYPRASFAVLDMAGHNLHIEQEEIFNCLVNEWLLRVEDSLCKE